ncbi:MAG: hypothetical protein F4W91_09045 [Gemmatimonadetes bacterium]|nr:hypothetical protein [Gemmatimonadota bacterium]
MQNPACAALSADILSNLDGCVYLNYLRKRRLVSVAATSKTTASVAPNAGGMANTPAISAIWTLAEIPAKHLAVCLVLVVDDASGLAKKPVLTSTMNGQKR